MRILQTAVLAGIASLALVGASVAREPCTHVLTVRLPDGSVEQVHYSGNQPPQIVFARAPRAVVARSLFFAPFPSFAQLDQVFAEMNRQAAALFREAESFAALPPMPPNGLSEAAASRLPRGSRSYSFVATFEGNRVCTQSLELTSRGNGEPPLVTRHSSGDCAQVAAPAAGAAPPLPTASPPMRGPRLLSASAAGNESYAGLVDPVPLAAAR